MVRKIKFREAFTVSGNYEEEIRTTMDRVQKTLGKLYIMKDKLYKDEYINNLIGHLDTINRAISAIQHNEGTAWQHDYNGYPVKLESIKKPNRKYTLIESSDLTIDMWYDDEFNKDDYAVDCTFYPNHGVYRGNIYRLGDGKIVGDYSCSDSAVIETTLGYNFD
jgi:hypothetical protein